MVLTSKFPQEYAKFYTLGHGMTGIFSATLQVIAITVGKNEAETALIYFLSGTSVLFLSIILFYYSKDLTLFQYYMNASEEDTQRSPHTWNELKSVLWKMMPVIVNIGTFMVTIYMFHPSLTSLIKSEYHSDGSAWSSEYNYITFNMH